MDASALSGVRLDASRARLRPDRRNATQTALTQHVATQLDGFAHASTAPCRRFPRRGRKRSPSTRARATVSRKRSTRRRPPWLRPSPNAAPHCSPTNAPRKPPGRANGPPANSNGRPALHRRLERDGRQARNPMAASGREDTGATGKITQTLGTTAGDLVAAHQRQAETTIAEVTPDADRRRSAKAAAEVIGELRHRTLGEHGARQQPARRTQPHHGDAGRAARRDQPRLDRTAQRDRRARRHVRRTARTRRQPVRRQGGNAKPASLSRSAPASPAAHSKSPAWAKPSATPCSCSATPTRR